MGVKKVFSSKEPREQRTKKCSCACSSIVQSPATVGQKSHWPDVTIAHEKCSEGELRAAIQSLEDRIDFISRSLEKCTSQSPTLSGAALDVAVKSINAQVIYLTTHVQSLDVMVQQFMVGQEKGLDEVDEHEDKSDELLVSDEHEVPGVAQG